MLDQEEVGHLRRMMQTEGWSKVMKPYLVNRGNNLIRALCRAPSERPSPYKDLDENVMRGELRAIEGLLNWVENEVAVADHNRQRDELDAANGRGEPAPEGVAG